MLQSGITTNPSDDFRLYCLQHKYQATLTYAPERLQEGASYRRKVEHFASHVHAAVRMQTALGSGTELESGTALGGTRGVAPDTNAVGVGGGGGGGGGIPHGSTSDVSGSYRADGAARRVHTISNAVNMISCKPTVESRALLERFQTIQEEVDAALRDDFDTPLVLQRLAALMTASSSYAQAVITCLGAVSKQQQPQQQQATGNPSAALVAVHSADTMEVEGLHDWQVPMTPTSHPVEPLLATSAYVTKILLILGLRFPSKLVAYHSSHQHDHSTVLSSGSAVCTGGTLSDERMNIDADVIDAVLEFRSQVRTSTVHRLKTVKQRLKKLRTNKGVEKVNNSEGSRVESGPADTGAVNEVQGNMRELEEELRMQQIYCEQVLHQCDAARDRLCQLFQVKVEDIGDMSTWTPRS